MGTSQGQPIILVKIVWAPALEPSLLYMALILLAFQRELSRFSVEKKTWLRMGLTPRRRYEGWSKNIIWQCS